jgi:hypothetical protein
MTPPRTGLLLGVLMLHATVASAQARRPPRPPRPTRDDITVSINVGGQITGYELTDQFSLIKNTEPAPVAVVQPFSPGVSVDGGVMIRVRRRFGIAADVSFWSREHNATVNASVPHPLFFNQPRAVSGTAALSRSQTAIHVDAAYLVPPRPRRRTSVAILGGVSIFRVGQTLPTDINLAETYPFDTATLASVTTADASAVAVGFNGGVDVNWRRWRRTGLGVLVRYSRATTSLSAGATNSVNVAGGGLQAAAGFRFVF